MAAELGISRGLVLDCYSQLQAEGFLTSRAGSATRVAAGALTPTAPRQGRRPGELNVQFAGGPGG
jgi:GntR family transcriptional regulator/MocR family aminotransferase